jgi:hypothetical protein
MYYLAAVVLGLILGAAAFELLDPILDITVTVLPLTADLTIEIGFLALLLYACSSAACSIARLIIRGIVYLCFEMRGDLLFYLMILAAAVCVVALITSALLPPVVPERVLITASGLSAAGTMLCSITTAWLYFRYRWPSNPSGHEFDHDIGLAWSHMTDPRRARFAFGRRR